MPTRATHPGAWFPAAVGALLVVESVFGLVLAAIPLGLALSLVVGGVRFARGAPDGETVGPLVRWMVGGAVGAVAVGAWTAGYVAVAGGVLQNLSFVLASNVTVGVLFGVLLGLYDVRARNRQAQVEDTRAQAHLERDRFAALFDNVSTPVVYYEFGDDSPVFRDVNAAFERVFGFGADEVLDRSVDDVLVPPDGASEADDINRRIRDGEAVQRELRRKTAHGPREFHVSVVPLEGDADRPPSGFFIAIDITDRKRRDHRLQVLNRVLRHDLRNAMNVVLGYVDFIATDPELAEDVITRRAREMVSLSETARDVEEALDVAADATHVRVDAVPVLRDRLDAATDEYGRLTVRHGAFPESAAVRVRDPELLATAVDNVVENAVEHCDHDDPTLRVDVSVAAETVTVRFADDGPGIPEPELEVLASEHETQLEHLSGLGLWLVNWILEDADGEATFESTEAGAVVTFELQRAVDDDEYDLPTAPAWSGR